MKPGILGSLIFVTQLLGLVPLSALLVTVILSQSVHRHIIFIHFVFTHVLSDSAVTFFDVAYYFLPVSEASSLGVKLIFISLGDCVKVM
ncbi:hypothetical protein K439DRAFT_869711 [Ramaria rubella]|nr:hypothetical protein K439DRAFT_869711 [Ramaria rubella]